MVFNKPVLVLQWELFNYRRNDDPNWAQSQDVTDIYFFPLKVLTLIKDNSH